jgi:protease-4
MFLTRLLLVLTAACLPLLAGCTINANLFGFGKIELIEFTIESDGTAKALLLSIDGAISSEERGGFLGSSPSTVDEVRRQLKKAADKESGVKVVILRINSPGGGATASDTIYTEIANFRETTGIPVVAYFQDLAASGGYYIAMAADEIVAQPTTITGSIGVIAVFMDVTGLMDMLGVKAHVVRSSEFKASGSPFIEKSEGDLAQAKSVIEQMYERFVTVVQQGRPDLTEQQIRAVADGQVFMGPKALELGMVDHIGYFDMARERAAALAGVDQVKVVTYTTNAGDKDRTIYTAAAVSPDTNRINIDLAQSLGLSGGSSRFLYYWAP